MISRLRSPLLLSSLPSANSVLTALHSIPIRSIAQQSALRSASTLSSSSSSTTTASAASSISSTPSSSPSPSPSSSSSPSSSLSSRSLSSSLSSPSPSSDVTDLHRLIIRFRLWGNDPHLFGRIVDKFVYTLKQNHGFTSRPPAYKRVKVERYAMKKSPFKYEYARRILIRKSYSCEVDVPIPPKYYLTPAGWDPSNPLIDIESFGDCIAIAEKGMRVTYKWTDSFIDRMSNIVSQTDADLQASYIHDIVPTNFEALYPSHYYPVDIHLAQEKWKMDQIKKEQVRSMEERLKEFNEDEARRADQCMIMRDDVKETGKPRLASIQEQSWREMKNQYIKYLQEKSKWE